MGHTDLCPGHVVKGGYAANTPTGQAEMPSPVMTHSRWVGWRRSPSVANCSSPSQSGSHLILLPCLGCSHSEPSPGLQKAAFSFAGLGLESFCSVPPPPAPDRAPCNPPGSPLRLPLLLQSLGCSQCLACL